MDSEKPLAEQARVPFGDGDSQSVPIDWAQKMLTDLHDNHPVLFGKLLVTVVTEGRGVRQNGHRNARR